MIILVLMVGLTMIIIYDGGGGHRIRYKIKL